MCNKLTLKNAGVKNGTVITAWNGKPIDVIVPFDEKAAAAIFENGEDYLLDYAVGYVKS